MLLNMKGTGISIENLNNHYQKDDQTNYKINNFLASLSRKGFIFKFRGTTLKTNDLTSQ